MPSETKVESEFNKEEARKTGSLIFISSLQAQDKDVFFVGFGFWKSFQNVNLSSCIMASLIVDNYLYRSLNNIWLLIIKFTSSILHEIFQHVGVVLNEIKSCMSLYDATFKDTYLQNFLANLNTPININFLYPLNNMQT